MRAFCKIICWSKNLEATVAIFTEFLRFFLLTFFCRHVVGIGWRFRFSLAKMLPCSSVPVDSKSLSNRSRLVGRGRRVLGQRKTGRGTKENPKGTRQTQLEPQKKKKKKKKIKKNCAWEPASVEPRETRAIAVVTT